MKIENMPRIRLLLVIIVLLRIWVSIFFLRLIKPFIKKELWKKVTQRVHTSNAEKLYKRILLLKGLFIKVGQFMSMRVDILPKPYTAILSKLQDQVPPHHYSEILFRIEEELKSNPEYIFEHFEKEPIAAASLGQVHKAVLIDGRTVAVKVQYPGIERIVETDFMILKLILSWIGFFRRNLQWKFLYEEFKKNISMELDYMQEGKNAERIRENLSSDKGIVIPEVLWEYTTGKVLTLEYIDGIKVTKFELYESLGIKRDEVMKKVIDCYFRMIFKDGVFQADPHPGNIFVLRDGRIALVDFGLTTTITKGILSGFGKMAMGVTGRNPELLTQAFIEMGFVAAGGVNEGFRRFSEFVIKNTKDFIYKNPRKINIQELTDEIIEIVREYPLIKIPSDFLLMGRVMGLLLGLGRFLKARVNVNDAILPYILNGINKVN